MFPVQDSGTGSHRKPYAVEPQLAHRGGWGCLRFNRVRLNRTPVFLRLGGPAVGRLGGGYSSRARLTAVEPPGTRTQGVAGGFQHSQFVVLFLGDMQNLWMAKSVTRFFVQV